MHNGGEAGVRLLGIFGFSLFFLAAGSGTAWALKPGDRGAEATWVQHRLGALHYYPGPVTGRYGPDMTYAVWAFEAVNGLRPDSVITGRTWRALRHPKPAPVLEPGGPANRIEVDIPRQILGEPVYIG